MLSKPRRAAIYVRVSTEWQTTDNQLLELQRVAEFSGWKVVGIYRDNGVSGGKGRDQRSEFDRLLKDATARRFDVVMAWSLDRLSRSLRDLVSFLGDMRELGRDLYLHKERIDTTTTAGKLMFQVCGAFAEFERETIRERVLAGLARAKAQGRKLGRPRVARSVETKILRLRTRKFGIRHIAREVGVGTSVVQRVLRNAA
jgi:DNA invertase Pin-like site-specific DNA recombinase